MSYTCEIYIFVLLLGFMLNGIKKTSYVDCFIALVKPKLVITYIDNSLSFFSISHRHPKLKTMFIQNGTRGYLGDIFEKLDREKNKNNLKVNYMMTFGRNISLKYKKYLAGETISIGSLRNNEAPLKKINKKNLISFVSQYRDTPGLYMGNKFYDFETFWEHPDKLVLQWIKKYAGERNLEVRVIPCAGNNLNNLKKEKNYFKKILGSDCKFSDWDCHRSSYSAIDESKLVVALDSSMAFEAVARGTKAAIFSIRGTMLQLVSPPFLHYGWPGLYKDTGPFWTNLPEPSIFRQILDHLISLNQRQWRDEVAASGFNDILAYDPGNSRIKKIFEKELRVSNSKTTT